MTDDLGDLTPYWIYPGDAQLQTAHHGPAH